MSLTRGERRHRTESGMTVVEFFGRSYKVNNELYRKIRVADFEDAKKITELAERISNIEDKFLNPRSVMAFMDKRNNVILVHGPKGEPDGFVAAKFNPNTNIGEISYFSVSNYMEGKGLGSALFALACQTLERKGASIIRGIGETPASREIFSKFKFEKSTPVGNYFRLVRKTS